MREEVLYRDALFHDQTHVRFTEMSDVIEGIAPKCDEIRRLSPLEGSGDVLDFEDLGAGPGRGHDSLHLGHTGRHQGLYFIDRLLAVRRQPCAEGVASHPDSYPGILGC